MMKCTCMTGIRLLQRPHTHLMTAFANQTADIVELFSPTSRAFIVPVRGPQPSRHQSVMNAGLDVSRTRRQDRHLSVHNIAAKAETSSCLLHRLQMLAEPELGKEHTIPVIYVLVDESPHATSSSRA
jgi:hypothetical protein